MFFMFVLMNLFDAGTAIVLLILEVWRDQIEVLTLLRISTEIIAGIREGHGLLIDVAQDLPMGVVLGLPVGVAQDLLEGKIEVPLEGPLLLDVVRDRQHIIEEHL